MLTASITVVVTAILMVKLNHICERNSILDLHACILVFSPSNTQESCVSLY